MEISGAPLTGPWTSYTPTITSGGGALTGASITTTARYVQAGSSVFWRAIIAIASVGSGSPSGAINFSLAVPASAAVASSPLAAFNNSTGAVMTGLTVGSVAQLLKSDGTTAWAAGTYIVGGVYEAA